MDAVILGQFIANLRKEQKMTQRELAEKINVTDKAVSKWERGKGIPDICNLELLSKTFNISMVEMLECKKNIINNTDKTLLENDIKQYSKLLEEIKRKNYFYRNLIIVFCMTIGMLLLISGAYLIIVPSIPFSVSIFGGNDGPSAIYLVSKVSINKSIFMCILGTVCTGVGIIIGVKEKRRKND